MRGSLRQAFALLALVLANQVYAQVVTDFSGGPLSGRYLFSSTTPKSLPELIRGMPVEPVNIVGHWFLPPGTGKVPAVVLMHGSGGIYSAMLDYWPKQFNAAGIAVLAVDSFTPRGVQSTADDQSQVPFAADTADAYAALRLLATHPRVDPARIALMGFSRGGITTWRAALQRVIDGQKLANNLRFAAYIPVYSGGCVGSLRVQVRPGVFAQSPMLWVHGDADDYTPIGPCQEYAKRITEAGTSTEFVVIPGAHHKFDMDDSRRTYVRGAIRTLETCPLEMDISTYAYFDRLTGQRLQGDVLREVQKNCAAVGAHVEGNTAARDKANQAIQVFLRKVFQ